VRSSDGLSIDEIATAVGIFVSLMSGGIGSDGELRAIVAAPARSQLLAAVGA